MLESSFTYLFLFPLFKFNSNYNLKFTPIIIPIIIKSFTIAKNVKLLLLLYSLTLFSNYMGSYRQILSLTKRHSWETSSVRIIFEIYALRFQMERKKFRKENFALNSKLSSVITWQLENSSRTGTSKTNKSNKQL